MKPIYKKTNLKESTLEEIETALLALPWETKRTARHEYFMADGVACDKCHRGLIDPFPEGSGFAAPPVRCTACAGTGRRPVDYSYGRQDDGISYTSKPWSSRVFDLAVGISSLEDVGRVCFNGCFLNKYDDQNQHLGWHADDFEGMDPAAPIAVMSFGAEREIWVKRKFKACRVCDGSGLGKDDHPGELNSCVECGGSGRAQCPECKDYRRMIHRDIVGGEVDFTKGVIVTCPSCHGKGGAAVTGAVPPEDRYLLERGSLFIMPPGFQEVMLHRIPKHPQPCGWRISLTFRKFL